MASNEHDPDGVAGPARGKRRAQDIARYGGDELVTPSDPLPKHADHERLGIHNLNKVPQSEQQQYIQEIQLVRVLCSYVHVCDCIWFCCCVVIVV